MNHFAVKGWKSLLTAKQGWLEPSKAKPPLALPNYFCLTCHEERVPLEEKNK